MKNDPFAYLHRAGITSSGIQKGVERAPKVKTVTMAVKRPPEFPSRTPAGPREGHKVSGKRPGGDGWKPGVNPPARVGKEYAGVEAASPGGNKAKAASPARGTETQSAHHDPPKTAKRVGAKRANIEGNESPKYEKLERKTLRSLAKGGSEKEKREGHNAVRASPMGGSPSYSSGAPAGSLPRSSAPIAPRPPQRTTTEPPKSPFRPSRPNMKRGRMAARRAR